MLIRLFIGLLVISSICAYFNTNFIFIAAFFCYLLKTLLDIDKNDQKAKIEELSSKINTLEKKQEEEFESMRNKIANSQISRTLVDRR